MVKKKSELGLIHCYYGDGKGKTTVSLGLALRAIGHGFRVHVVQFMKGGIYTGEVVAAEKYLKRGLRIAQFGQTSPYAKEIIEGKLKPSKGIFLPFEEETELMKKALDYAAKTVKSKKYDIVILDEINVAMDKKLIDTADVIKLLLSKPKKVEIVLTGRNPPKEIIEICDYANEIKSIKHPFNRRFNKVLGRKGIEY